MISSVGSQIQAYSATKLYPTQATEQGKESPSTSLLNQREDNSKVRSLRDFRQNQINSVANNDDAAEKLLKNFSRPDSGGVLFAVGSNDIMTMDTTVIRRMDRINELFNVEQTQVESKKTDIIAEGLAVGKTPQKILDEIFNLYDSQSELFKTGRGWDGQLFSFGAENPSGYQEALKYTSDVIDIQA